MHSIEPSTCSEVRAAVRFHQACQTSDQPHVPAMHLFNWALYRFAALCVAHTAIYRSDSFFEYVVALIVTVADFSLLAVTILICHSASVRRTTRKPPGRRPWGVTRMRRS